jgi:trans-aconitate 2-methyltransferase
MSGSWSPSLYLQFGDERTRPARDLLAQVPLPSARLIVDVGCGPGNSTRLLADRFRDARVIGLDSSAAMLAEARSALPHLEFIQADASAWLPDPDTDLVFANAIYQWIPDHLVRLPRLVDALRPGAVLAVQMPDNLSEPTHRLMQDVARNPRWMDRLVDAARAPLPPARVYYDALKRVARHVDIWHIVYNHVLAGADAIVDWVRGTGLRPFLDPLTLEERSEFLSAYRQLIADAYPPTVDGHVLLRFPRLFILAVR